MNEPAWSQVPIRDLAEINPKGFRVPPSDHDLVTFLPMPAIQEISGKLDLSRTRPWQEVKKGFTRFQDGDVLFAKITPSMENGKIAVAGGLHNGRGAGTTELHVFRPTDKLEPDFLRYYLLQESFLRRARANMTGTAGQLRVPVAFLEVERIPIARRSEQRRIVEAIEAHFSQLDAAVAALHKVRANMKRYRASVLKAACLNPNLPNWQPLNRLVDPNRAIAYGVLKPGEPTPGGVPMIKTMHVWNGRLLKTEDLISPELSQEFSRTVLRGGEVLLTVVGSIGRTAVAPEWAAGYNLSRSVAVIPLSDAGQAEWVRMCLETYFGTRMGQEVATGTAQAVLNVRDVREISIPIPPAKERRAIAADVERRLTVADALGTEVDASLKRCARMRQAILKKAFEGRLVPQEVEPSKQVVSPHLRKRSS